MLRKSGRSRRERAKNWKKEGEGSDVKEITFCQRVGEEFEEWLFICLPSSFVNFALFSLSVFFLLSTFAEERDFSVLPVAQERKRETKKIYLSF